VANDSVKTIVPGSEREFSGVPAMNSWEKTSKTVESAK